MMRKTRNGRRRREKELDDKKEEKECDEKEE